MTSYAVGDRPACLQQQKDIRNRILFAVIEDDMRPRCSKMMILHQCFVRWTVVSNLPNNLQPIYGSNRVQVSVYQTPGYPSDVYTGISKASRVVIDVHTRKSFDQLETLQGAPIDLRHAIQGVLVQMPFQG